MTSDDLIRPVGGIGTADRFAVGGKAAGLGELCRAGLPVPRAFVVTALAFARAMQDIDPAGEFDAWRLRELARIKRDKEAEIAREQEREEVERRRALPEEQRLKEDLEHAKKSRDEKPKGEQKFLQKYWHKGAFHQVRLPLIICVN